LTLVKDLLIYIKALIISLVMVVSSVLITLIFIPVGIILFLLGAFKSIRVYSWHRSRDSAETSSEINVSSREYTILSDGNKLTNHPSHDPKSIIIEGEKSGQEK